MSTTLTPEMYESIAEQVNNGTCALFLGPAAISVQQLDGTYAPLIGLCAQHLAQKYNLPLPPEETTLLAYVMSILLNRNKISDLVLRSDIQKFYRSWESKAQLHPMLTELAELPFSVVINTTPDNFFTFLYAGVGINFQYYNFERPDPNDPLYKFAPDQPPLIYNLFGFYGEKT